MNKVSLDFYGSQKEKVGMKPGGHRAGTRGPECSVDSKVINRQLEVVRTLAPSNRYLELTCSRQRNSASPIKIVN